MKTVQLFTLTLLASVSLVSAQWGGKKVKGNGTFTTVERSVGGYEGIAMSGWFDLEIVAGQEGRISIEAEENLLEYIETEVKDGTLKIKTRKGYQLKPSSYQKGVQITVPVESVSSVSLSGSGDIVSSTVLKSEEFETAMSGSGDISLNIEAGKCTAAVAGSGDINLSGTAGSFKAAVSGSGDISAYGLSARKAEVAVSGSGDIQLTVTEELTARVSGSGDINYRGNPAKVDSKVAGSGDIEGE